MAVGTTPQRIDAVDKVTGAATYPADRVPDNALHAVVVFTNQPHARLVDLDLTETLSAAGVVTVVTAADVPVNEYGLTLFDQPVFIGLDDTGRSSVPCDVSRWEADHLVVVVAENLVQARKASALIKAQWEILPLVSDVSTARSDEVLVHPNSTSNTYHELRIRKGDSVLGMELADVVIEDTYELPHQEHAYLQVEAATAWFDDDKRVTVETSGQWVHEDREQIAHALDVDPEEVRVRYASIGGAFGGKEDMSLQIVMAVTAKKLNDLGVMRPVHCCWTREESIVGHHKRHRATVHARLGATADGIITAVEAEVLLDAGAYNYTSNKVLGNLHLSVAGAYDVPNAHIDSKAIYTHSVPGGAFRGFGGPQGAFVAESQMNKMAHALGLDPLELRSRNALDDLSDGITQSGLPEGVGVNRVIEACVEKAPASAVLPQTPPFRSIASLPAETDQLKQGRGYAVGMKNVGFSFGFPEACEADVDFHGDPDTDRPTRVELFHSAAEVGQGVHTALVQMVADAADINISNIDAIYDKKKIEEKNLQTIISEVKEKTINGINVTVPFKKAIIPYLNKLSPEAEQTQSVNTIILNNDKLVGHNTDIFGFDKATKALNFNMQDKKIVILGAGGVVPSIIFALNKMNVSKIFITNRTKDKAENLKSQFYNLEVLDWGEINDFDVIINATSLGLKNESINLDFSRFANNKLFYDVIYNPEETNFLKEGKKFGNKTENGN